MATERYEASPQKIQALSQKAAQVKAFFGSLPAAPATLSEAGVLPASGPGDGEAPPPWAAPLLSAVDQIRTSMVTRDTLQQLHQLHSEEIAAFVHKSLSEAMHETLTEIAEVRDDLSKLQGAAEDATSRVALCESKQSSGPVDPRFTKTGHRNDPAHRQILFKEFPSKVPEAKRIEHMEAFMKTHFQEFPYRFAENIVQEGPPGKSKVTTSGFVEFGSQHRARQVMDKIKASPGAYKLSAGGKEVTIKKGTSALDRRRNYGLYAAKDLVAELVKAEPSLKGATVEVKDRSVLVNGQVAYSQKERFDPIGGFMRNFSHLELP